MDTEHNNNLLKSKGFYISFILMPDVKVIMQNGIPKYTNKEYTVFNTYQETLEVLDSLTEHTGLLEIKAV